MTEPDGRDELRARLRRAEDDARAARFLAGGADRDTAELRAEGREFHADMRSFRDQNNRMLSAMREDLTDMRRTMDEGLMDVSTEMRQGFTGMRGLLDAQAAFSRQLADLLGVLIRQQGGDRPEQ